MKKIIFILFLFIAIFAFALTVLNINTTSKQCINYKCHEIKIPLYLKILDFFTRHYHYKQLVEDITQNSKNEQEKAIKIFEWVNANIRKTPPGFPIVDDHALNIIIRGYGADDQFSDVFSTLCNYAGLEASFQWVYTNDRTATISLSFVKIDGKWFIFDPYRNIYFKKPLECASVDKKNIIGLIESASKEPEIDYSIYLNDLPLIKEAGLTRASIQSPLKRFIYQIKVLFLKNKNLRN